MQTNDVRLGKRTMLLVGAAGCGTTLPAQALARILFVWLIQAAGGDVAPARVHCDGLHARRMASHRSRLRQ
jgi:ATP-dependent protease Clp ATPase subunit